MPNPILKKTSEETHTENVPTSAPELTEPTERHLSPSTTRLAFLWESYQPKFWYWELVETTRRLMLTVVLSVCGSGSSQQGVLAILLTLFYVRLYTYYGPYADVTAMITAETGLFQTCLTFLGALITLQSLLQPRWNTAVDALLILVNLSVAGMFLYFEIPKLLLELNTVHRKRTQESTETELQVAKKHESRYGIEMKNL